jgi:hypothetical protein
LPTWLFGCPARASSWLSGCSGLLGRLSSECPCTQLCSCVPDTPVRPGTSMRPGTLFVFACAGCAHASPICVRMCRARLCVRVPLSVFMCAGLVSASGWVAGCPMSVCRGPDAYLAGPLLAPAMFFSHSPFHTVHHMQCTPGSSCNPFLVPPASWVVPPLIGVLFDSSAAVLFASPADRDS